MILELASYILIALVTASSCGFVWLNLRKDW
jgi:hypothetical protein